MAASVGIAAVLVLAGGEGRRMGRAKAWLDWQGRPLLLHVIERLSGLAPTRPITVARAGQKLPPGDYDRVDDRLPDAGPLAGLAAGLEGIDRGDADARVAVSACDYPFAEPDVFRFLAAIDPVADVVVPRLGPHLHPLQAVWRASAAGICEDTLVRGERRVRGALAQLRARVVPAEEFPAGIDLSQALLNLNEPRDRALARRLRS